MTRRLFNERIKKADKVKKEIHKSQQSYKEDPGKIQSNTRKGQGTERQINQVAVPGARLTSCGKTGLAWQKHRSPLKDTRQKSQVKNTGEIIRQRVKNKHGLRVVPDKKRDIRCAGKTTADWSLPFSLSQGPG